jgi:hypothetical protein
VSAYVEGESLDALRTAAPDRRLPLEVELQLALDVLAGLGALHALSARDPSAARLHGQLDPRNVILEPSGRAVVVQLGGPIPLLAEDAWLRYLAPELLLADDTVDHRVDIYSVGVVLWEALSGAPFVSDTSPNAILVRHLSGKIGAPTVPADAPWASALVPLLVRAVSTDPASRFQSAAAFAEAIRAAAGEHVASSEDVGRLVTSIGGATIEARRARLAKHGGATSKPAPIAAAAAPPPAAPPAAPPARTPGAPPPKLQLPSVLRISPAASPWAAASAAAQHAAAPAAKAPLKAPPKPLPAMTPAAPAAAAIGDVSDAEISPPSQRMTTPAPQPAPADAKAPSPAIAATAAVATVAAAPPTPPTPAPVRTPAPAPIAARVEAAAQRVAAPIEPAPAPLPTRTQLAIAPIAPIAPIVPIAPIAPISVGAPNPPIAAPFSPPPEPPPIAEEFDVVLGPPSVPPVSAHAKSDPAGPAVVPSVPPPPPSRRSRGLLIALALLGLLGITFAAIRLGGQRDEPAAGSQATSGSAKAPRPDATGKSTAAGDEPTATASPGARPSDRPPSSAIDAAESASSSATSAASAASAAATPSTGPADDAGGARTAPPSDTSPRPDKPKPKPKPATPYEPLGI